MDYQNRAGSKHGGGGMATQSDYNRQRQERMKNIAQQYINVDNDPYIKKLQVGTGYECVLCKTTHQSTNSYLAHTQGKRHSQNLMKRAASQDKRYNPTTAPTTSKEIKVKKSVKIGLPGYKITKIRDPLTHQVGLLFQIKYPDIGTDVKPRYRIMSAYEQKIDTPDPNFQYLLVAAEPYETCGFKIEAKQIDDAKGWTFFDPDSKEYFIQLFYTNTRS